VVHTTLVYLTAKAVPGTLLLASARLCTLLHASARFCPPLPKARGLALQSASPAYLAMAARAAESEWARGRRAAAMTCGLSPGIPQPVMGPVTAWESTEGVLLPITLTTVWAWAPQRGCGLRRERREKRRRRERVGRGIEGNRSSMVCGAVRGEGRGERAGRERGWNGGRGEGVNVPWL